MVGLGWRMRLCVLFGLLQQHSSHLVNKGEVLMDVTNKVAVCCVSFGELLAEPHHRLCEEFDSFVRCFISLVIAIFVSWPDFALIDHLLCGMALNLGDGYGIRFFGSSMFVIHVPHVPIPLQSPRSLRQCVLANVIVDCVGLGEEAATIGA